MVAKILYSGTITQVSKLKNFPSNGNNTANFKRKMGYKKKPTTFISEVLTCITSANFHFSIPPYFTLCLFIYCTIYIIDDILKTRHCL